MKVKVTDHARFDSFPLRFGFVPDEFLELTSEAIDEHATQNQKPREIRNGNKHYIGRLWTLSGEDIGKARVVMAPATLEDPFPRVVTALSVDHIPTDRAVTEIIQLKRRRNQISTDFVIAKLHPLYKAKKLSSPEDLIDIFVDLGVTEAAKDKENLQRMLDEAEAESEALAKRNEALEQENRDLIKKIESLERSKPGYRGEGIEISLVATLANVEVGSRMKANGQKVSCTFLTFKEPGVPVRKMDHIFDPSQAITRKAQSMIGQRVRTTTWKPEIFKPLDWFRDIYPATQ